MIQDLQRGEVSLAPLRPRDHVSDRCGGYEEEPYLYLIKLSSMGARLHVHDVVASESDQLGEP